MDSFNLEALFGGRKTHKASKTKKSTTRRHRGGDQLDLPTQPEKLTESLEKIKEAVINKNYNVGDVINIIAVLDIALKKNIEPEPVVPATSATSADNPAENPLPLEDMSNEFARGGGKRKSSKAKKFQT